VPLTAEPAAVAPEAATPPPKQWAAEPPPTVIDGRPHWSLADLRELWAFRELLYFLTLRDIKLRYKQTILGVGWSVLQPVATMAVFVLFLGRVSGMAEGVDNYALFVLAGLIPWTFFSSAVTNAGNSLIGNERLVTKTYFPRLLLPAANVAAAAFDCLVCSTLLVAAVLVGSLFGGQPPTWRLLLLPAMGAGVGLTAFGFGTLLSALIATQRDFRYLLNFGMQLWLFATVCIYRRPDLIGADAQRLLPFNPAYGLILNFRAAALGSPLDWYALFVSGAVGAFVLGFALIYFRRVQQNLADTI
jgi:lipopolysaccharide transport system permease protein